MKKVVIKIGTKVLTDKDSNIDEDIIHNLVEQICKLLGPQRSILIVSSGAIGVGMGLLNIKSRPQNLAELQSIAAIGQTGLMNVYNKYFNKEGYLAGQILLTQDDFDERRRYLNIKYTINALLAKNVIPIVNENDTISTEEIKCGDNDRLSSLVADLIGADALIILTDVDGLFDRNNKLIERIDNITDEIKDLVKDEKTCFGRGGMYTKLEAAEFSTKSGIECYIANGKSKNILINLFERKGRFTHFRAGKTARVRAKKRWIGFGSKAKGTIIVDAGAKEALLRGKKSLLSAGIVAKKGNFKAGDTIGISLKDEKEFARGIVNYSSEELTKIKGVSTKDIEGILGYKDHDEVVHRDNLVIL